VLVLVNTDVAKGHSLSIDAVTYESLGSPATDLLGQPAPLVARTRGDKVELSLGPGACYCLAPAAVPAELRGDDYRELRAQAAWAITMISRRIRVREISPFDWRRMAALVQAGPCEFLAAVSDLDPVRVKENVLAALESMLSRRPFPLVVRVDRHSLRRIITVPRDHWLLIEEMAPFRATLHSDGVVPVHAHSLRVNGRHIGCFPPGQILGDARNVVDRHVVAPYVSAHAHGSTPNPCVECNRHLKFERLLERADRLALILLRPVKVAR